MNRILEFLSRKGMELIENNYDADCLDIAGEIAAVLLEEGAVPQIEKVMEFSEKRDEELKPFKPSRLANTIWRRHFVCCVENIAYEPLLGKPVPKPEYCRQMFGEDIVTDVVVSKNGIKNYVENFVRTKSKEEKNDNA